MMIKQLVDALQPVITSWQNPRITRQLSWFSSDVCLQKSHLLEFLVLQLGGYQVLGNCHNCQLTLDTFQWPKMMVTLCHLSCFFSLGVRFQDFLHLSLLKGVILGCIFMKLFFFKYLLFLLFLTSQVLDLELLLTPNLFRGMFAYHLFLIWHCSLEIP